jgi:hypothetical protein
MCAQTLTNLDNTLIIKILTYVLKFGWRSVMNKSFSKLAVFTVLFLFIISSGCAPKISNENIVSVVHLADHQVVGVFTVKTSEAVTFVKATPGAFTPSDILGDISIRKTGSTELISLSDINLQLAANSTVRFEIIANVDTASSPGAYQFDIKDWEFLVGGKTKKISTALTFAFKYERNWQNTKVVATQTNDIFEDMKVFLDIYKGITLIWRDANDIYIHGSLYGKWWSSKKKISSDGESILRRSLMTVKIGGMYDLMAAWRDNDYTIVTRHIASDANIPSKIMYQGGFNYYSLGGNDNGKALLIYGNTAQWYDQMTREWTQPETLPFQLLTSSDKILIDNDGNATVLIAKNDMQIHAYRYTSSTGWMDQGSIGTIGCMWPDDIATTVDASGNVYVAYNRVGNETQAVFIKFDVVTGWQQEEIIYSYENGLEVEPSYLYSISANNSGQVAASWNYKGKYYLARYDGTSWDEPQYIRDSIFGCHGMNTGIDDSGNILAVWDGNGMMYSRYSNDTGEYTSDTIDENAKIYDYFFYFMPFDMNPEGEAVCAWVNCIGTGEPTLITVSEFK